MSIPIVNEMNVVVSSELMLITFMLLNWEIVVPKYVGNSIYYILF
jgi:hypothetical protein